MENIYDKTSPESIENYAQRLLNSSLRKYFHGQIEQKYEGKGKLGQLLEKKYFGYNVNSRAEADFPEAGVELKCTPVKVVNNTLVSKERLVLNIINYFDEADKDFRHSSFWNKNKHLLLMFYLWEQGKIDIDYVFKIINLWRFPASDLKIIKDDWTIIHNKILQGKAHEITEGDTFYMAACMKGSTKEKSKCKQPFSNEMAQRRAYSLKNKYMNSVIRTLQTSGKPKIDEEEIEWILDDWSEGMAEEPFSAYKIRKEKERTEAIIKDVRQYNNPQETFAEYVVNQFEPFFGEDEGKLFERFGIKTTSSKSKYAILTKGILGIKKDKIDEFEKAGITIKTIRLTKTKTLKESMSFPTMHYNEIIKQKWEDSDWYATLSNKFFFVVFQEKAEGTYYLKNAFFWNIPYNDLDEAQRLWEDTKAKIQKGDYEHFGKISESEVCHVRPHGRDSRDLAPGPDGHLHKKYCFWLNRGYIKGIVDKYQQEYENTKV